MVNVPSPPSAPEGLLGLADGSELTLAWQNTLAGGTPTGIVLDVAGDRTDSIELPFTDRFSFSAVPTGTYTFSVRAVNAVGSSSGFQRRHIDVPWNMFAAGYADRVFSLEKR